MAEAADGRCQGRRRRGNGEMRWEPPYGFVCCTVTGPRCDWEQWLRERQGEKKDIMSAITTTSYLPRLHYACPLVKPSCLNVFLMTGWSAGRKLYFPIHVHQG